MKFTIIIPQAPPLNETVEEVTGGTLYAIGPFLQENPHDDILLSITADNDVTTIISLKDGLVYPSLPGNAVQLPIGSSVVLTQGNLQ